MRRCYSPQLLFHLPSRKINPLVITITYREIVMIKYVSALTLALFSMAAVAQNSTPTTPQPAVNVDEAVQVAQAQQAGEEAAPGAAAGGVAAAEIAPPAVFLGMGLVAVGAIIASAAGGGGRSSTPSHSTPSHH